MEGFGFAQIKQEGKYYTYNPTNTMKCYGFVLRNSIQRIRNYGRELKNGKGLTGLEICDLLNSKSSEEK